MMSWKVISKKAGDAQFLRVLRRLPRPYLLAIPLFLILFPQFCYEVKHREFVIVLQGGKLVLQVSLQIHKVKDAKSIFGDNLLPTPWHLHDRSLGPDNRTWERSLAILKCSVHPSRNHPSHQKTLIQNETRECPSYFQWIEKDLAPWKLTGITPTNIEMAQGHAAFKVVILKGRIYVDLYYSCAETRAVFTVWGLLMLLETYQGKLPDVEMMFDCMDRPHIKKTKEVPNEIWSPAPLFRYCSNSKHYDIPWPDWSFWGWSETKLDPWDQERIKIRKGADKKPWMLKASKAHWKGTTRVASPLRTELMQCNSATKRPEAEIFLQNSTITPLGKGDSKLENQCLHRYKIYAEGFAWSASLKYIMACGSPTLAISPKYYDFFMRGLEAGVHYIPVRPKEICAPQLCSAIDNAVRKGEKDIYKVIKIGAAGQDFVNNEIGMPNVYDYMFHMLKAYAGLQRFTPSVPRTATEVTQDFILCLAQPHERLSLEKSREQILWTPAPCHLPKTPEDGVKDFAWEAPEHGEEEWSEKTCVRRLDLVYLFGCQQSVLIIA